MSAKKLLRADATPVLQDTPLYWIYIYFLFIYLPRTGLPHVG